MQWRLGWSRIIAHTVEEECRIERRREGGGSCTCDDDDAIIRPTGIHLYVIFYRNYLGSREVMHG